MKQEKRWLALFCVLILIWSIAVTSTLYQWISGQSPLVDTDINLYYFTLPLLCVYFLYFFVSIFIACVYLVAFSSVKNQQKRIIESGKSLASPVLSANLGNKYNSPIQKGNLDNELCSIIIPSRNEQTVIGKTVRQCLLQTYKNIEVIVICHNCDDRTFYEAQIDDSRVRVFEVRTKEAGKGIALNEGVKRATGKYILILDSDALLSKDFIETALPLFNGNYAAVQGRYVPSNRDYNLVTKLLALEGDLWSTPYMTVRSWFNQKVFLGGTGYIIRTDVLNEVGNFTNHLVDDFELSCRLLKKNHKIAFVPLSVDYDEKPPTFEIMIRQRARWAKGFISLLRQNVIPPTDILGNILLVAGYNSIFNIMFGYFPYVYAFIPLYLWFASIGLMMTVQCLILIKQYGIRTGLKYVLYLPIYNLFSTYIFVAFLKALFVKSWSNTKTEHGFVSKKEREQIEGHKAG
jgi:poly-beta-1,6-N-acetyl-D-glucosamine synthase